MLSCQSAAEGWTDDFVIHDFQSHPDFGRGVLWTNDSVVIDNKIAVRRDYGHSHTSTPDTFFKK